MATLGPHCNGPCDTATGAATGIGFGGVKALVMAVFQYTTLVRALRVVGMDGTAPVADRNFQLKTIWL
jgi:hypothetical protein